MLRGERKAKRRKREGEEEEEEVNDAIRHSINLHTQLQRLNLIEDTNRGGK